MHDNEGTRCQRNIDYIHRLSFSVIIDDADNVLAWSVTMQTLCPCSHWLCGHGNDYTDTDGNFESFSLTLKEQQSLGCVYVPSIEGYLRIKLCVLIKQKRCRKSHDTLSLRQIWIFFKADPTTNQNTFLKIYKYVAFQMFFIVVYIKQGHDVNFFLGLPF